ncbi:hypothetical protein Tco_0787933 [Tanacetum coccineum]
MRTINHVPYRICKNPIAESPTRCKGGAASTTVGSQEAMVGVDESHAVVRARTSMMGRAEWRRGWATSTMVMVADGPSGSREDYFKIAVPLYEASLKGHWEAAKAIFDKRPELIANRGL